MPRESRHAINQAKGIVLKIYIQFNTHIHDTYKIALAVKLRLHGTPKGLSRLADSLEIMEPSITDFPTIVGEVDEDGQFAMGSMNISRIDERPERNLTPLSTAIASSHGTQPPCPMRTANTTSIACAHGGGGKRC